MRRSILSLALVLVAGTAVSLELIGIYNDPEGPYGGMSSVPCTVLEPNVPINLYIVALLEQPAEYGIVAAEFKVDNWLGDLPPELGQLEVTYTSEYVIGDLGEDLAIAWTEPVGTGTGMVLIATITATMLDSSWIGPDHWMQIVEGEICDCLVVVDHLFNEITAWGDRILLNCEEDCGWCIPAAAGESNWSTLKSLY